MISHRIVGLGPAFRRAAAAPKARPADATRSQLALRLPTRRGVQTQSVPRTEAEDILNAQRIRRPSSPHFTIYQPQLTWLGSIANRGTGVGLGVLLYGFSISYIVAPAVGMPFSSADVISAVSTLPESVKYAGKVVLAAPFAYHAWNGLRHLAWDLTKFTTLKGAYATGYAVLGATAATTVALVLM